MEYVHFSVDAEWFTKLVRSLWALEDAPDRAIITLQSAFPEMSWQQIFDILEGRSKLVAAENDNMSLVEDTDAKDSDLPSVLEVIKRLMKERDDLKDKFADLIQLHNGDTEFLGSPTGQREVPRRKCKRKNTGYGLKDGLTWDDIEIYGQREYPGVSETTDEEEEDDNSNNKDKNVEEADDKLPPPEAQLTITEDGGWLTPDGKFYVCRYMEHIGVAYDLGMTELEAEEAGWVKLSSGELYANGNEVTQKQFDMLFDYFSSKNRTLPTWLRVKGEVESQ